METAEQNTKQFTEENDLLRQFMELLKQQNMRICYTFGITEQQPRFLEVTNNAIRKRDKKDSCFNYDTAFVLCIKYHNEKQTRKIQFVFDDERELSTQYLAFYFKCCFYSNCNSDKESVC